MTRGRRQSALPLEDRPAPGVPTGESVFLPGLVPVPLRPDPRADARWRRVRRSVLERDRDRCRQCGRPASEVDHRVELVDGGEPFDPNNLQALCADCHQAKSADARYLREQRAAADWGRMAVCPRCEGTAGCPLCPERPHPCGACLGAGIVPEASASGALPSQRQLARARPAVLAGAVVGDRRAEAPGDP